jgi:two-component system LytT family response regulator
MPKLNGFVMLELIDDPPEVIFITAHNEYAIKAFEMNAVDYLLKPYSKDRLLGALQKAVHRISSGDHSREEIQQLIHQPLNDFMERIVVKSGSKIKVIPVSRIIFLKAEDDYVMIHTDDSKHLKKGTMKFFEEQLDPSEFVRVHRSYIVRVDQVTTIEPYSKENYSLKLKNNVHIRISRSGYKNIREKFRF